MKLLLHATAVAFGDAAVLLVGPPGAGKSDLALRLIDRGALLVADDQVDAEAVCGRLIANAPAAIAGLLEIRGVGLIALPFAVAVPVILVCDLGMAVERLPCPAHKRIGSVSIPLLAIAPFEASAPNKVERAVALGRRSALWHSDGGG